MNRTIPGNTINELMSEKTAEISAYNLLLAAYNKARSVWDGSLRVVDGFTDWSNIALFLPQTNDPNTYIAPTRPEMPYRPTAYTGPTFADTSSVGGYGAPTSSMYVLQAGQTSAVVDGATVYTNVTAFKEFGVFGTSSNATTTAGNAVRNDPPASGTCRAAYMAVTLLPTNGYTQSTTLLSLQFMSGAWRDLNMTTPIEPPAPIAPQSKTYQNNYFS
jgi:hypothetical protein